MKSLHLVVLAILGVGIMLVVNVMQKKQEATNPPAPAPLAGPPAGALFIEPEVMPLNVVESGNRYINYWVPEPGWQVSVEGILEQDNGKVLKIGLTQSNPLYGQMWVAALVPLDTNVSKGDFIMLTGRIDKVEKIKDGGPVDARRLVLMDAKVLKNLSHPD